MKAQYTRAWTRNEECDAASYFRKIKYFPQLFLFLHFLFSIFCGEWHFLTKIWIWELVPFNRGSFPWLFILFFQLVFFYYFFYFVLLYLSSFSYLKKYFFYFIFLIYITRVLLIASWHMRFGWIKIKYFKYLFIFKIFNFKTNFVILCFRLCLS